MDYLSVGLLAPVAGSLSRIFVPVCWKCCVWLRAGILSFWCGSAQPQPTLEKAEETNVAKQGAPLLGEIDVCAY